MTKLLSTNTKLEKQNGEKYLLTGLALAPHRRSGHNVCPEAGFCSAVCNLWFSGRTVTRTVREAMLRRTEMFLLNRARFEAELVHELVLHEQKACRKGLKPLVRLNVASDLDWNYIAESLPCIQFYDYTKVISRVDNTPPNYRLTYSFNEFSDTRKVNRLLKKGYNVSMVFDTEYNPWGNKSGELPEEVKIGTKWHRVVDGDGHDIRLPETDGVGVVVGLRFKGSRKLLQQAINSGFVVAV